MIVAVDFPIFAQWYPRQIQVVALRLSPKAAALLAVVVLGPQFRAKRPIMGAGKIWFLSKRAPSSWVRIAMKLGKRMGKNWLKKFSWTIFGFPAVASRTGNLGRSSMILAM